MGFPFQKPTEEATPVADTKVEVPVATTEEVAVPPVEAAPVAAAVQEAPVAEKAKVKRTAVRKATKIIDKEDIEFVCGNIKTMSYAELATARTLTKSQVNRILMDIKKKMRKGATEENKDSVEAYILDNLTRPDGCGVGKKGAGKVETSLNSVVDDILGSLS